jgi:hypothetical protein
MKKHLTIIKKLADCCEWEVLKDDEIKFIDCFVKKDLPLVNIKRGELIRKIKLKYREGEKTAILEFHKYADFPPRRLEVEVK